MDTETSGSWEQLLDRYCAGECTPAELVEVRQWVGDDPERQVLVDRLVAERRRLRERPGAVDVNTATGLLQQRLARHCRVFTGEQVVVRGNSRYWSRAAAAFVGLCVVGMLGGVLYFGPSHGQAFREFATTAGSQATVTLQDGTRMVLAPASRIRIAANFGQGTREVELTGRASFAVVHDEKHPFVVRTVHALTRDIGTRFVVDAYDNDASEQVAVAEGEVALGGNSLRRNDVADIDLEGRVIIRRGVGSAALFAWMQGSLVFDGAPLGRAARDLERTFNLEITIADSTLAGRHVTGSFGGDATPDAVLDAITRVVGAQYVRTGRKVVIRLKGADEPSHPVPQQTASTRRLSQ